MSKRLRLVLVIIGLIIVIGSGAVYGLAKTGVIDLGLFADTGTAKLEVEVKNSSDQAFGSGSPTPGDEPDVTAFLYEQGQASAGTIDIDESGTTITLATLDNLQPSTTYKIVVETPHNPYGENCKAEKNMATGVDNSTVRRPITLTCQSGSQPTEEAFSVTGTIKNADNQNLQGVAVVLEIENQNKRFSVRTNTSGQYTISNVPIISGVYPDSYEVTFSKSSYQTKNLNFNELYIPPTRPFINGERYNAGTLRLDSNSDSTDEPSTPIAQNEIIILGKVVDENGRPVEANLTLECDEHSGTNKCYGQESVVERNIRSRTDLNTTYGYQQNYLLESTTDFWDISPSPGYLELGINTEFGTFSEPNLIMISKEDINSAPVVNNKIIIRRNFRILERSVLIVEGWVGVRNVDSDQSVTVEVPTSVKITGPNGYEDMQEVGSYDDAIDVPFVDAIEYGDSDKTKFKGSVAGVQEYMVSYRFIIEDVEPGSRYSVMVDDNSYQQYKLVSAQTRTITFGSSLPSYRDGFVARLDFFYELDISSITENFDLIGAIRNIKSLEPEHGVQVSISILGTSFVKSYMSSFNYFLPENNKNEANYVIENIPMVQGAVYKIKMICNRSTSCRIGEEYQVVYFDSTDIMNNDNYERPIMRADAYLSIFNIDWKDINYFSAQNKEPINIENEKDYFDNLVCNGLTGSISCVDSKEDTGNRTRYSIGYDKSEYIWGYNLRILSDKYDWMPIDLPAYNNDSDVYLVLKEGGDEMVSCRKFEGFDFCTLKVFEEEIFSESHSLILGRYGKVLSFLALATGINKKDYPDIWLSEEDAPSSYAIKHNPFIYGDFDSDRIINLSRVNLTAYEDGLTTIIHEFGHIIDFHFGLNEARFEDFETALNSARGLNNNGTPILDDDDSPVKSCNKTFYNYLCFGTYAIDVSPMELWAEFFTYWTLSGGDLHEIYNDPAMQDPANKHCLYTLKFLDALMQEQFPDMIQFDLDEATSFKNSSNVLGASVSANEFKSLMAEAGYSSVSKHQFNLVGRLVDLQLNPEQIAKGLFLRENFNKLSWNKRLVINANTYKNKVFRAISNIRNNVALVKVKNWANRLNDRLEGWLIQLGFKFSRSTIYGRVVDQKNRRVPGLQIKVGSKSTVTNKNGWYQVKRLQTGRQKINIYDPKLDKEYYGRWINVKENQTISRNIQISRKYWKVQGVVEQGDHMLRNGKLRLTSITGQIRIVKMSRDGSFKFWQPEGRYKIDFLDKNWRKQEVINSGNLGNLRRVIIKGHLKTIVKVR